jgi:predicted ATPase
MTTSAQLLGREADLATIADTMDVVGAGDGNVLVVEGPRGSGRRR